MLYSIEYVTDKDKNEKEVLKGAKIFGFNGEDISVKEVYVGLKYNLEEILGNEIIAKFLGINNLDVFKAKYEKVGATGVIYFPELNKYEYLEEGDVVIPFVNSRLVKDSLDKVLRPYKKAATNRIVKQKLEAKKVCREDLDPADPLIELKDLSLSRHVSSR